MSSSGGDVYVVRAQDSGYCFRTRPSKYSRKQWTNLSRKLLQIIRNNVGMCKNHHTREPRLAAQMSQNICEAWRYIHLIYISQHLSIKVTTSFTPLIYVHECTWVEADFWSRGHLLVKWCPRRSNSHSQGGDVKENKEESVALPC